MSLLMDLKLVVVASDVLDAVLSTDLGAQRCFKFLKRQLVSQNKWMESRSVACGFCGVKISPMIGYNTNIPHIF